MKISLTFVVSLTRHTFYNNRAMHHYLGTYYAPGRISSSCFIYCVGRIDYVVHNGRCGLRYNNYKIM